MTNLHILEKRQKENLVRDLWGCLGWGLEVELESWHLSRLLALGLGLGGGSHNQVGG